MSAPISASKKSANWNHLEPENAAAGKGFLSFPFGSWWIKGQSIRGGIAPVRQFQELLKTLIERDNAKPSFVITKRFRIEDGATAFREFSDHKLIKAVFEFDTPKRGLKRKNGHSHE